MKTLTLEILKEDILKTSYYHCDDCAITRALRRVKGCEDWLDRGSEIVNKDNRKVIIIDIDNETYKDLTDKVVELYSFKHNNQHHLIHSFTHILKY